MNSQMPVKEILLKGIVTPFSKASQLIKFGWPFVLLFIIPESLVDQLPEDNILISVIYYIAVVMTLVLAAVGCHRVFLLDAEEVNLTPVIRWSYRETRFVFYFLAISILAAIIAVPFEALLIPFVTVDILALESNTYIFTAAAILLYLPAYYITSRWLLVLPDSAVDNTREMSWAWNASKGHSLRLFFLVGLIPILTNLIFMFLSEEDPSLFLEVFTNIVWIIVGVIEICILSLSYEWINLKTGV